MQSATIQVNTTNNGSSFKIVKNGSEFEYTWHHYQDGKTMMPVKKLIHDLLKGKHTGGATIVDNTNIDYTYLKNFFTYE